MYYFQEEKFNMVVNIHFDKRLFIDKTASFDRNKFKQFVFIIIKVKHINTMQIYQLWNSL